MNVGLVTKDRLEIDKMFRVRQVFVNAAAKDSFFKFFLKRVNGFAQAHSSEWQDDMAWSIEDVDKLLNEFSFSEVGYPFSKPQLTLVASWIKEKYDLFKRYSAEEIAAVFARAPAPPSDPSSFQLKDYITALITALKNWEECPVGFGRVGIDDIYRIIFDRIFQNPPRVQDPPLVSEEEGAPPEEPEDQEVPSAADSAEVEIEEAEEEEKEEEEETEEIITLKKVKKPEVAKKEKTKQKPSKPFTAPKGPKLVECVKSLLACLEVEAVPTIRQELVKFGRSLEKETNAKKFYGQLTEKAFELTKLKKADYVVGDIIDYMISQGE